jgi:hypothetical protein
MIKEKLENYTYCETINHGNLLFLNIHVFKSSGKKTPMKLSHKIFIPSLSVLLTLILHGNSYKKGTKRTAIAGIFEGV